MIGFKCLVCNEASLPVVFISGVHCESSHFMSVLSQLFVAGHAVSIYDVDNRVLRANPHLLLVHSQHAILHRIKCDMAPFNDGELTDTRIVHISHLYISLGILKVQYLSFM